MRIGIDATCWWSNRGFGRFTRELLKAMFKRHKQHTYCLFIDRQPTPEMTHPNVEIIQVTPSRTVTEAAGANDNRSIADVWVFTKATAGKSLDLMYFPAVYSYFPVKPGLPVVLTMHDAIAEHFPEMIFPDMKGRLLWKIKTRLALWQAKRIMTVSNAAKAEIIQYMGVKPDHIDVVTEAANPCFYPVNDPDIRAVARANANLPVDVRLIAYVGGLAPHKNLSGLMKGLVKALEMEGMDDVHLALIGDPAGDGFYSNFQCLQAQVESEPKLKDRVHFTGYVSDEDLVAIYSDSLAVALPSFSEGFGLPAIEAMACGVPVLASNAGSVPEVVGDAGLYFDPNDHDQIAIALHRIATEPGTLATLRQKALDRSAEFTWDKAADLVLSYLEQTAEAS